MIKKKFGIKMLILAILLVSMAFVPVVSAETLSENTTDIAVSTGLVTSEELNSIIEQIPPTDPYILEKMSENESAFRTYGKVPEITTGIEVYKWLNTLDRIRVNLNKNNEMKPYCYPAGPVVAYGTHADGYFWVIFDEGSDYIENEDFDAVADIINKQATKLNITDVPIAFSTGAPINTASASINQVSRSVGTPINTASASINQVSRSVDPYLVYHRPIIGGIAQTIVNGGSGANGTIGFAAKRNSDNANGYVTAGHVAWFQTGLPSYQPTIYDSGNQAGTVSKIGVNTDAAFIPYSNVAAQIHTGGGNLVNVQGYYSGGISGMTLIKSGRISGSVTGEYTAVVTGYTIDGHYIDTLEVMSTTCYQGDSGGPVYAYYNGRYKLVGIICASTRWIPTNTPSTVYIPCGEIVSKLGVTPLTA